MAKSIDATILLNLATTPLGWACAALKNLS